MVDDVGLVVVVGVFEAGKQLGERCLCGCFDLGYQVQFVLFVVAVLEDFRVVGHVGDDLVVGSFGCVYARGYRIMGFVAFGCRGCVFEVHGRFGGFVLDDCFLEVIGTGFGNVDVDDRIVAVGGSSIVDDGAFFLAPVVADLYGDVTVADWRGFGAEVNQ